MNQHECHGGDATTCELVTAWLQQVAPQSLEDAEVRGAQFREMVHTLLRQHFVGAACTRAIAQYDAGWARGFYGDDSAIAQGMRGMARRGRGAQLPECVVDLDRAGYLHGRMVRQGGGEQSVSVLQAVSGRHAAGCMSGQWVAASGRGVRR
ncbi:hypothetical protein [Burkholderia ubonensis]|uniref:hypothetical protein n=1 Tax=Burkholderia ubonensis TaxID=101571 RepID=UPI00075A0B0F|nr:hypothetical protein [Burkholderia ubonensis]KVW83267.1 hypothetical protein WK99_19210 [Burkholderia ubonensis]